MVRAAKKKEVAYPERVRLERDKAVIREALEILEREWHKPKRHRIITSPAPAKELAMMVLAGEEREHFWVAFLNTRHQLIEHKVMFSGTIDSAAVYPREVAKEALRLNAAAVLFAHNHPSGITEPSADDVAITKRLKDALKLVDVWVLDHLIIGGHISVSLAERGLL